MPTHKIIELTSTQLICPLAQISTNPLEINWNNPIYKYYLAIKLFDVMSGLSHLIYE